MSWVITVEIDRDKANVGTAMAVFTDDDNTIFSFMMRDTMTVANATRFASDATAARNDWKAKKGSESNASNVIVGKFTDLGETATAGTPT